MIETSHGTAHHIIWCPRLDRSITRLLYSYSECHSLSFITLEGKVFSFEWAKLWGISHLTHTCFTHRLSTSRGEIFVLLYIFDLALNRTIASRLHVTQCLHKDDKTLYIRGAQFSSKSTLAWRRLSLTVVSLCFFTNFVLSVPSFKFFFLTFFYHQIEFSIALHQMYCSQDVPNAHIKKQLMKMKTFHLKIPL